MYSLRQVLQSLIIFKPRRSSFLESKRSLAGRVEKYSFLKKDELTAMISTSEDLSVKLRISCATSSSLFDLYIPNCKAPIPQILKEA